MRNVKNIGYKTAQDIANSFILTMRNVKAEQMKKVNEEYRVLS